MRTTLRNILFVIFCFTTFTTFAQKPEPVYSFIRVIHDFDWYQQQAKAWRSEIDKGTKDKMAWVYFFKANRMAGFCDHQRWESQVKDYFLPQEKIIKLAEKAIPNSFELYFLKAHDDTAGGGSGTDNILKAQAIRPFDKLLLPWLMNHYQFANDKANIELTSKKWFESNEMPQEILITAYNNLISLDQNAILIVNGDNDTYPYWILQNAQKVRPDVLILNASLNIIDSYRERIFNENGIQQLTFQNDSSRNSETIVKHLINNVHDRPIYVSIFVDSDIYNGFEEKMYMTGLSFKYSEKSFDNLAVIRNNVENKYLLDFLKHSFYNNYAQSAVNQMNAGYLSVFLKLYENYQLSGETTKAQQLKQLAKTVAENTGNTNLLKYFEK